ncbi:MFS transporter [Jiangella endophytica]|uniref:MFS transporter n=1 Tax=Jiangella endophytica TaxID=1623398 RepID=UPI0018E4F001|nr:MFS transporter [Jiangella endophytica]
MRRVRPSGDQRGSKLAGPRGVLAALCLTQIVGWGVLYYSFPVALPAITTGTDWSESSTTAAFSAALVVAAVAGIAVGRIIDRHGPRWVMTLGSVIGVAATLAVASAPSVGWFAAAPPPRPCSTTSPGGRPTSP